MSKILSQLKIGTLTTPLAIIIGSIIIGLSIVSYGFIVGGSGVVNQSDMFTGRPVDETDYIEGNKKSDVVVIEYSDTECPYCILAYSTLKQLRNDYADRVAFVYRNFPLTSIHPNAFDESKAIVCAGIVGGENKYFEYMDALFGYKVPLQSQENPSPQLPQNGKEELARGIGLNMTDFASCMNTQTTAQHVDASLNDGAQAGVSGTPSTFVLVKTWRGYKVIANVEGARPYDNFKAAVDEALAR
jgi:protein-disulfide isomerase